LTIKFTHEQISRLYFLTYYSNCNLYY
jgi:hypothetical protein